MLLWIVYLKYFLCKIYLLDKNVTICPSMTTFFHGTVGVNLAELNITPIFVNSAVSYKTVNRHRL